jgi:hypothetical protein
MKEELKTEMMREAMKDFVSSISENDGVINGAKYSQDLGIEMQVRIDYLNEVFGKDETERELSKYRKDSGGFIDGIMDETIWNSIVSNLRGENI